LNDRPEQPLSPSTSPSHPERLLPLSTPVLQILLTLSDCELDGYGIIRDIEDRTGGEVTLSTSTLYGAIKRMLRDGLIEESDYRPDPELDDERRRYYRISDFGREVAALEARRIERLAEMVRGKRFVTRSS
jgi:DNA-binding PadR family transcriptional regulator